MLERGSFNSVILVSRNSATVTWCKSCIKDVFNFIHNSSFPTVLENLANLIIVDCASFSLQLIENFVRDFKSFHDNIVFLSHGGCHLVDVKHVISFPCNSDYLKSYITTIHCHNEISLLTTTEKTMLFSSIAADLSKMIGFERLAGISSELQEMKSQIATVADKNLSVLILGESGTGKSLAARLIYENSSRRDKKYKHINVSTIHEGLAESELFGSVPGAYTGAVKRAGCFAETDGGTLFLDEIAEMPLSVQAKLLTVLDNGTFCSVGSDKEIKVDVRVICATNADLKKLVECGKFRKDLYYRIAEYTITLPSLSPRRQDIPYLVNQYLSGKKKRISDLSLKKLIEHTWPGNIRELQNCLKTASELCPSEMITVQYIRF